MSLFVNGVKKNTRWALTFILINQKNNAKKKKKYCET